MGREEPTQSIIVAPARERRPIKRGRRREGDLSARNPQVAVGGLGFWTV